MRKQALLIITLTLFPIAGTGCLDRIVRPFPGPAYCTACRDQVLRNSLANQTPSTVHVPELQAKEP